MPKANENVDPNLTNSGGDENPPEGNQPEAPPVTVSQPKKVELTEDEIEERIAAALKKQAEATAAEAKRQADIEAGNVRQLLDSAEAELKKTQLALWRSQALRKHGLKDNWFDALNGENEKEIDAAAKNLKKRIDDEVAASTEVLKSTSAATPPGGKGTPPSPKPVDSTARLSRDLARAFDVGSLPRRNYTN